MSQHKFFLPSTGQVATMTEEQYQEWKLLPYRQALRQQFQEMPDEFFRLPQEMPDDLTAEMVGKDD